MEYRGIRYILRARIERGQWSVAIYPPGDEMRGRVVFGSREEAEFQAREMINDWLKRRSTHKPKSNRCFFGGPGRPVDEGRASARKVMRPPTGAYGEESHELV